ncbi:MAG: DUF6786 family protein [Paraglaciecola sp.]|uniref:DUF6786 family protein n=1 Tax=Paraglaciecola sp. TaxID=1920173 RepID=UPI0032982CCA
MYKMAKLQVIVMGLNLAVNTAVQASIPMSFDRAVDIMSQVHKPIVLRNGKARAAVLAEFQGRVMVTSANGDSGNSLGWFNVEYMGKANEDNNSVTGGASRLWFGPETGPYSVFFRPNESRIAANIQVPSAVSTEPFTLKFSNESSVEFVQSISLRNHFGFTFRVNVERNIRLFNTTQIQQNLDIKFKDNLNVVGFSAVTKITNIGDKDWHQDTGILSIWELGAFHPSDHTTVFIPLRGELEEVTSYFTPTLNTHTRIQNNIVYYKTDANYMNKIGIPAANSPSLVGSYDSDRKLLTVFEYQLGAPDALYNNSVWYEEGYQPYGGDIINIFNDGLIDGTGPFGPFYEMETSSSAVALKIDQSHQHFQNTYHFIGDEQQIAEIVESLFGLSLQQITQVFNGIKAK